MGDLAASGGYYISSAANTIFAEPTSIVGSIGVVGGKIAFGNALEKIGVHAETFAAKDAPGAGARAAYESPLTDWDDATKARVLESMTGVYELFLARVAEGRATTPDKIAPFAEGRIFSGVQAKEHGLVDELGGLRERDREGAIAGELAGRRDGERAVVEVEWPARGSRHRVGRGRRAIARRRSSQAGRMWVGWSRAWRRTWRPGYRGQSLRRAGTRGADIGCVAVCSRSFDKRFAISSAS